MTAVLGILLISIDFSCKDHETAVTFDENVELQPDSKKLRD